MTRRICLWSGPRNVSTAVMYAFAQRDDTRVVDEPLYAHYLRVSGAAHPGREAVMESQDDNGRRVIEEVILGDCDRPVLFIKQMAHHVVGLELDFVDQTDNAFLIRDPVEMLPSLIRHIPKPNLADTGLVRQAELHRRLVDSGHDPVVLDAKELLLGPESVLRQACGQWGIDFQERMLSWQAGPRPEDGVWASLWYQNVHRSTGFVPYRKKAEPFPEHLRGLLKECQPHYAYLKRFAIKH